jgi:hypothetical protein
LPLNPRHFTKNHKKLLVPSSDFKKRQAQIKFPESWASNLDSGRFHGEKRVSTRTPPSMKLYILFGNTINIRPKPNLSILQ